MTERLGLPRLNRRHVPLLFVAGAVIFAVAYVVFIAQKPPETGGGNWRTTTFGSAVDDPGSFLRVFLDSITFAGALFIVASGFALIFGLMRVVNMAHGAFYLLGGSGYAGGKQANQSFSAGLAATAGGIGLRDPAGKLVDSVGYGTATNAFVETHTAPAPPVTALPGSSDIRLPDGTDTDDNGADFTVTAAPTPGTTNAAG